MEYQAKEIAIFKDDEFLLMLAAAGIENWYGIDFGETIKKSNTERVFNSNLASLYMKQIVEWNDEKARIAEPYRSMFKALRDAKVCVTFKSAAVSENVKGFYCSKGGIVTIEKGAAAIDEVEVSMQSTEEWLDELIAIGCFPESAGEPDEKDVPDVELDYICEFELHDVPSGKLIETLCIYEYGLYGIIKIRTNNREKKEYFDLDRTLEILRSWSGGIE